MDIKQLNKKFALDPSLSIAEGDSEWPLISVNNDYASARISLYGGQVLSFKPHSAEHDLLFFSTEARYKKGTSIRGGIPLCWPWFGSDPLECDRGAHGFARTAFWRIDETSVTSIGETRISLNLSDNDDSLAIWPHGFELNLTITVGESLHLTLTTHNVGNSSFNLSQALHTYFKTGDIRQVRVEGLHGLNYLDKTQAMRSYTEQQQQVTIVGEVDRIYQHTPNKLIIRDEILKRNIHLESEGSESAVLWNPGSKSSERFKDLAPKDYERFLCLEIANAGIDNRKIAASEQHKIAVHYALEPIP